VKLSAGDSGRSISIDCLRGVAALAVLVHHVIKDDHAIGNLGTAGVYLFFLISGYCIVLSLSNLGSRPIRNFLIRRFFRLYPIYWIAVFFAAFLSEDRIDAGQIAANLTMVQTALRVPDINGVFWTLFIELVFYAVVVVFIYLKIERKPAVFLTGAITLSLGALLAAVTGRLTGIPIPYGHLLFFSLFMHS
jgi:peptidoglycan/LPS O-acetylase OafA/YrhL